MSPKDTFFSFPVNDGTLTVSRAKNENERYETRWWMVVGD